MKYSSGDPLPSPQPPLQIWKILFAKPPWICRFGQRIRKNVFALSFFNGLVVSHCANKKYNPACKYLKCCPLILNIFVFVFANIFVFVFANIFFLCICKHILICTCKYICLCIFKYICLCICNKSFN